jgi:hypothetical protein
VLSRSELGGITHDAHRDGAMGYVAICGHGACCEVLVMEMERTIFLVVDSGGGRNLPGGAWERFEDAAVVRVDVYHRAATEVALVAVSLRAGNACSRWIARVVARGIAVIDPDRMTHGDRQAFFASYLGNYAQVVTGCNSVAAALRALRDCVPAGAVTQRGRPRRHTATP